MTRARPVVLAGSSNGALAFELAAALGEPLGACKTVRFPDGEMNVEVGVDVRERDVIVVQPTSPPVGERLLELLLLADALRRGGAASVSAVVPYFGLARQERRVREGEALGARVAAEVLDRGGFTTIFSVDVHSPSIAGFLATPLEDVSAVPLLAEAARPYVDVDGDAVVVSPDLGGAKRARAFAERLRLPLAVVVKSRTSASSVAVREVFGYVGGRRPIVVDDLVSTGGTIAAAAEALRERGARGDPLVLATHAVLADGAAPRLARAGVTRLITTDTLPPPTTSGALEHRIVAVAPLLASALSARLPSR